MFWLWFYGLFCLFLFLLLIYLIINYIKTTKSTYPVCYKSETIKTTENSETTKGFDFDDFFKK